jgi:hypothetical protein
MRNLLVAYVLVLATLPSISGAAPIAYEPFNYTPGPITDSTASTATGFTGNWARLLDPTGDYGAVTAGSLTYTGMNSAAGKLENGHNRLTTTLDTGVAGPFAAYRNTAGDIGQDGTTLYLSFLMKVAAGTPGFVALELFRDGDADANRRLSVDVWTGHTGGGAANIWLTGWIPPGTVADGDPLIPFDTLTHLYMLKINFGAANADTVDIYVDPVLALGEPAIPTDSISVTDLAFDRILTSNFGSSQLITVDEIRFGNSFAAAVPEPASLALVALAGGTVLLRRRR